LKSPNFDGWFRSRQKEMTQKLEALHLEALCNEVRKMGGYGYQFLLHPLVKHKNVKNFVKYVLAKHELTNQVQPRTNIKKKGNMK